MNTIIKKQQVEVRELSPAERSLSRRGLQGGESCEKQVRLLLDHGEVIALELVCSCGEKTVVNLEYDETPEPTPEDKTI